MKRVILFAICAALMPFVSRAADKQDKEEIKEALQELQEFIGGWKGTGAPLKRGGGAFWTAKLDWSWRFKKDDIFLSVKFEKDKYWKSGELRYDLDDEVYVLSLIDAKDEKRTFKGSIKNSYLTMDRVDPKSGETQQLVLNTAGDGVRFVLSYSYKPKKRTRFVRAYRLGLTKEGESLGAVAKQKECIVTGGLGTMAVSYKGETFYVCCSGCRDAFLEKPEKFIAEFKKKKK